MMTPLKVLLLLSALARCRSFLVAPASFTPGATSRPSAGCPSPWRVAPDSLQASPRPSPESIAEARQRLISSTDYEELVDRVDARSPFADVGGNAVAQEEGGDAPIWRFLRFAADVTIILVPVVLCFMSGKLPPVILAPLGSAADAIMGSPIEPILEALPWEPLTVLRWAAQGGTAVALSPVADRFVVTPAINQWAQAKLRSFSK